MLTSVSSVLESPQQVDQKDIKKIQQIKKVLDSRTGSLTLAKKDAKSVLSNIDGLKDNEMKNELKLLFVKIPGHDKALEGRNISEEVKSE